MPIANFVFFHYDLTSAFRTVDLLKSHVIHRHQRQDSGIMISLFFSSYPRRQVLASAKQASLTLRSLYFSGRHFRSRYFQVSNVLDYLPYIWLQYVVPVSLFPYSVEPKLILPWMDAPVRNRCQLIRMRCQRAHIRHWCMSVQIYYSPANTPSSSLNLPSQVHCIYF